MSVPYSDLVRLLVLVALYFGAVYQAASYFYQFDQQKLDILNARHAVLTPNYRICDVSYNPSPECKDPNVKCKVTHQKCLDIVKTATSLAKSKCKGYIESYNSCIDTMNNRCNDLRSNVDSCVIAIVKLELDKYK
jgi:hypothetical protein